jgi:drug/metabolite transporter (DMT)-like permease
MRRSDGVRLLILSSLWGASFIFMKVLAPVLGPVATAGLRVGVAALAFLPYFAVIRFRPQWHAHWIHYGVVALFNVTAPILLFSYAAVHIPASYSVIINSSTPLFGTILSALFLSERLTVRSVVGLIGGIAGVALITSGDSTVHASPYFWSGIAACLVAAAFYALSGVYIKRFASSVNSIGIAGCSQLLASLVFLPFLLATPPQVEITAKIVLNVLALSVLCTTLGFLLYFRLLADVGPSRAMMVALLTPLFGVLWGSIFLEEKLTAPIFGGCALIIGSVAMILTKSADLPMLNVRDRC